MTDSLQPLIVCMENMEGEKVSLRINPTDTFQIFLDNAKTLLGYDVDLDSVTNNQPVALNDNIYTFLLNMEDNLNELTYNDQHFNKISGSNNFHEQEYVLDDGTQIKASQIQFDNEDPIIDLTAVKIPFVKYVDECTSEDETKSVENFTMKDFNIPESPKSQHLTRTSSPSRDFANTLPFKLFCKNISNFEAQFTKYLELSTNTSANTNVSNKNPHKDFNYVKAIKNRSEFLTREDVLNMFKDSPVTSLPYDENKSFDKRKHARKTDPSRLVHKNSNSKAASEADTLNNDHGCCICDKIIDSKLDKSYIFDKEDQMIHRCEQKKNNTQLKIICTYCLRNHFQPSLMKSPSQSLNNDEYLVIQNNQQFIFQKITNIILKKASVDLETIISNGKNKERTEFVKVEIGPDGEIITKPIDNDEGSDDVIIVEDKQKEGTSDVEIIEPDIDCDDVNNIEDEALKEFLGKYEKDNNVNRELKCRFCERMFESVLQVVEHGEEHKHDLDDGPIYPCPLCDYGYAQYKWLKCHIKAVHDKIEEKKSDQHEVEIKVSENLSRNPSPVARRTRSSIKKNDSEAEKGKENQECEENALKSVSPPILITEVKQECLDSSDEEAIWILQAEDELADQIGNFLQDKDKEKKENKSDEVHKCLNCNQTMSSAATLAAHKCKKRGRKRKYSSNNDSNVLVPSRVDFLKRAQKPRQPKKTNNKEMVKLRKKRSKGSCDSQIVTCHNCNENFSSKVRLKFHMQFHETSKMLSAEGLYVCAECERATFATETELFDHVHFQHDKQKRWQCPVAECGKTFFLRATLTKHSRIHTDTRRYVCVTCGKRFLDKQTLDEHGVTHLQIKPFQCHICLKQLTRRSRLRMHLRAHEEELSPRLVLVCAVCHRAFRDHADALEHVIRSSECLEVFTNELKEDTEAERLSPTTGLVRQKTSEKEESRLSKKIEREVNSVESAELLEGLADAARPIVRVVNIEKAFRCEYCEDVFYLEDALNKHRNIHRDVKNPFTCHICKVSFATYSRCTTHKTTHGFYKRTESKGAAQDGEANAGILGYGGFPVVKHFLCEDCGRSYLHWTYLQVHRRMKHANEQFLFKCNHCDLTFPNSWSIAYHRKKVHGKTGGDDGVTKIVRDDYRIPCRDCDEVLPNKTALYKHRQKEHSDEATRNEDNIFKCSAEKEMTNCTKCGLDLQTSVALQKHMRETHGTDDNKGSHACSECHRWFRSQSVRNEHMRVHTGERPYPCDLCGVAFRRATAMRNHRLIHTGVRAWACPRCPKRFRIRSDLRTHLRLKHPSRLAVIEIAGMSPSPEEVLNYLKMKNIQQQKVLDITMISFAEGTTNIVPNSARALSMLSGVRRTRIACEQPAYQPPVDVFQPTRRGRGIAKGPCRPSVLQPDTEIPQDYFSLAMNDSDGLSYNMELLLQESGLVNGNQMVQLHLDDGIN